jgi:hypothetical protein
MPRGHKSRGAAASAATLKCGGLSCQAAGVGALQRLVQFKRAVQCEVLHGVCPPTFQQTAPRLQGRLPRTNLRRTSQIFTKLSAAYVAAARGEMAGGCKEP